MLCNLVVQSCLEKMCLQEDLGLIHKLASAQLQIPEPDITINNIPM